MAMPDLKFTRKELTLSGGKCYAVVPSPGTPSILNARKDDQITFLRTGPNKIKGFDINFDPPTVGPFKVNGAAPYTLDVKAQNVGTYKYTVSFPYDGVTVEELDPVIIINPHYDSSSAFSALFKPNNLIPFGAGIIATLVAVWLVRKMRQA